MSNPDNPAIGNTFGTLYIFGDNDTDGSVRFIHDADFLFRVEFRVNGIWKSRYPLDDHLTMSRELDGTFDRELNATIIRELL